MQLPTSHFNILYKDNREYNPLTKTSRQLRPLVPFKVIECDIKSAFPTFLDCETDATLKDHIYNNLMLSKGITRSEAKILFNKVCNSGKYKTKEKTILFFLECGYTKLQCDILIKLTHHPDRIFYSFMTEYEATAISHFITQNNLQRGARLHDALLFIDDKTKPTLLQVHPNCDFGYKELNRPIIKETFSYGTKRLPYAYINSIPKGFNLITKHEAKKPDIKGIANGFKFYTQKYDYISASFNLNNYFDIKDKDPKVFFYSQCDVMLSTLHYLNKRCLKPSELLLTLIHIRHNSNYIFNVRALYSRLIKNHWNKVDFIIRERDYDVLELKTYVKNIDYLNDLNEARKLVNVDVNHYNLFALLQERIINNDYDFLDEALIVGKRNNNQLTYAIITKFNLLTTGRIRKERFGVKKDPLYLLIIKRVLINSLSLKPQQQNASTIKGTQKYERDLKAFNRLINNRLIVQQLFLVVAELTGIEPEIIIVPNTDDINELKTELYQTVNNVIFENTRVGAKEFDLMFVKNRIYKIEPIELLNDNFDTDMSNNIFNQVDMAEAYSLGKKFFESYQAFHGNDEVEKKVRYVPPKKEIYRLPEIDFDSF